MGGADPAFFVARKLTTGTTMHEVRLRLVNPAFRIKYMLRNLSFVLVVLIFLGVSANAQSKRSKPTIKKRPVAAKPAVLQTGAVKTPSGLIYLVTKAGTGQQALAGQTVTVHYTGTLTDGTKFDSSRDRGEPISFQLGAGRVIKFWDEGIAHLRVGDQAILVIPPSIGYGERGAGGVIPANATLIFVVELVDAK
jgi:peptidylprolyl isomerase